MKEFPKINFSIINETKGRLPSLPFDQMKTVILGRNYDLCLNFVSSAKLLDLNNQYRNINKSTDILSFPLDKNSGEIFISPIETKKMMDEFNRSYKNFTAYLFIHGLVHLKGFDHGKKMESIEKKYRKQFSI